MKKVWTCLLMWHAQTGTETCVQIFNFFKDLVLYTIRGVKGLDNGDKLMYTTNYINKILICFITHKIRIMCKKFGQV